MAWVSEVSGSAIDSPTCVVTVPAGGYPVGTLLVMGLGSSKELADLVVSDSRGNSWTLDQSAHEQDPAALGKGSVYQLHCRIVTTLLPGDNITVAMTSLPAPPARSICVVEQFDDSIDYADVGSGHSSAGVQSKNITSGVTTTTTSANQLVVGAIILNNSGRTLTPGSGFTAGAKIVSNAGTGDRAVVLQWAYATQQGAKESYGTVESNAYWAATVQTFAIGMGAPSDGRSGLAKVWTGTEWRQYPAKVWNGAGWIKHDMKSWDGNDWRKAK